jgi:hypothetical protein
MGWHAYACQGGRIRWPDHDILQISSRFETNGSPTALQTPLQTRHLIPDARQGIGLSLVTETSAA